MSTPTVAEPISPLVADLISASLAQTHAVTDRLIDSLTSQLAEANATLDAIRDTVANLLDGPYMPTPAALLASLYPPALVVDRYREPPP